MRTRQTIYTRKIRRKNKEFTAGQWITVFAIVLLFAGFIGITENSLGIFIFLSLFILSPFAVVLFFKRFLRYILGLFSKKGEISPAVSKSKTEIFKTLLRDKNFINHHNYGNSEKYQKIYKKYLYRVSIKNIVIVSIFFSLGVCISGITNMLSSGLGFISMFFVFIFTFMIFFLILSPISLLNYYRKIHFKNFPIYYLSKNSGRNFIKYKGKIFFF